MSLPSQNDLYGLAGDSPLTTGQHMSVPINLMQNGPMKAIPEFCGPPLPPIGHHPQSFIPVMQPPQDLLQEQSTFGEEKPVYE